MQMSKLKSRPNSLDHTCDIHPRQFPCIQLVVPCTSGLLPRLTLLESLDIVVQLLPTGLAFIQINVAPPFALRGSISDDFQLFSCCKVNEYVVCTVRPHELTV